MLALILAAVLGAVTVYFSMQNQTLVSVQLGNYFWANVPLYFVSLVSLLVGISIAWLVSTVGEIGSTLTLWGKESEVNALKNYVKQLQVKLRDYSIENAKLRGDKKETHTALIQERIDDTKARAHGFFDRLRYRLTT